MNTGEEVVREEVERGEGRERGKGGEGGGGGAARREGGGGRGAASGQAASTAAISTTRRNCSRRCTLAGMTPRLPSALRGVNATHQRTCAMERFALTACTLSTLALSAAAAAAQEATSTPATMQAEIH